MDPSIFTGIFRGLLGAAAIIGIAFVVSEKRKNIDWRLVGSGLLLHLLLAAFLLKVPGFQGAVGWVSERFVQLLEFTGAGSRFLFGDLVDLSKTGYIFCFQVLPTVVFFSALTAALYHLGILQKIVRGFAWVMVRVMRVSGVESLAAAANVFLGQTEAPLVVRPFINQLSRSGMLCLMAGGMATIAGAVLGAYVGFLGGDSSVEKAAFAKILLSASLMNAPAAIVLAKMLIPDEPGTVRDRRLKIETEKQGSLLEAISEGTTTGLKLSLNIGACYSFSYHLSHSSMQFLAVSASSILGSLGLLEVVTKCSRWEPCSVLWELPSPGL